MVTTQRLTPWAGASHSLLQDSVLELHKAMLRQPGSGDSRDCTAVSQATQGIK